MKKTYIGIAFIALVFGIWAVPQIVDRFSSKNIVDDSRMSRVADSKIVYLNINNENKKIPNFVFTNQDSIPISNNDYKGKVYVVEFFFTTCPSICPIMNKNMLTLDEAFGDRDDFGIASFTIDPDHDTPMVLKQYAEKHGVKSLNWHFLTGNKDEVYNLSNKGLNIFTGINPEVAGGFEHQGFFALIDKQGYIRSRKDNQGNPIVYYQGTEADEVKMLKEDIKILLDE